MFFTIKWIEKIFKFFLERERFFIRGKEIQFTPRLFLATLLRMYDLPLWKKIIKEFFSELKPEEKELCEKGFDYLYAQDLFSLEFSKWYQEMLIGRAHKEEDYPILAFDFLSLKEQIRKQIQIPLLDSVKKLCMELEENLEKGEALPEEKVKKLKKLSKFFHCIEVLEPSRIAELVERGENILKKISAPLDQKREDSEKLRSQIESEFFKELQKFFDRAKIKEILK